MIWSLYFISVFIKKKQNIGLSLFNLAEKFNKIYTNKKIHFNKRFALRVDIFSLYIFAYTTYIAFDIN